MVGTIALLLANTASPIDSIDWIAILDQGGSKALLAWLIYDNIKLRQENGKINQEARDMAKSSVEALVRMASDRRS